MNKEQYFERVREFKLLANKSLGQNFLSNPDIASKIVEKLEIKDNDNILEIGAGLGSLSYFLCENPSKIELIDIDERMLQFLRDQFGEKENVEIKRQNILKQNLSPFNKIIGNLPYYITSGIIEKILTDATNAELIVLMTQKEVYPKLLSKNKSPLSLFLNYVAEISPAMDVNRNNFIPVPHVDSVVFTLKPNNNIKNEENKKLLKLIHNLFLLRRKNILNNLTSITHNKEKSRELLEKLGVSCNKRPEELDIDFFKKLLNLL